MFIQAALLFTVLFANLSLAQSTAHLDFRGQPEAEIEVRYRSSRFESSGTTCSAGPEVCRYEDLSERICDNRLPSRCWTQTWSEYRCSPGPSTCSGSSTSTHGPLVSRVVGVKFLRPEFKIVELPFTYGITQVKWGVEFWGLVPDFVPRGTLVGIRGDSEFTAKNYEVMFYTSAEFKMSSVKKIFNASVDEKTATVKFDIEGRIERDSPLRISIEGSRKDQVETTLRKLKASIIEQKDGSTSISFPRSEALMKKYKLLRFTLLPSFPAGWEIFGDKSEAEVVHTSKIRKN